MYTDRIILIVGLIIGTLFSSGCGLLVGNVKPVEEKSENYGVLDLTQVNPKWIRLEGSNLDRKDEAATPSEVADVAYQSRKNSSIISLNSACRPSYESPSNTPQDQDLQQFTRLLLMGISNVTLKTEKKLTLQEIPALETTLQGKMNGEIMMLRAVVLRRRECVYDLMYIARPNYFADDEADFSRFVASLRIR